MSTDYEWDVGFSFCVEDEPLAEEINDLLSDRYSTFLYSKRQEDIAANDGLDELSVIFSSKVRVVVIFYRERWDKKGYALIEANAIKKRILTEGLYFTIWVPRDKVKKIPIWAETQFYYDYEKYGAKSLMVLIEQKIGDLGGKQITVSATDIAKRVQKNKEYEHKLKNYIEKYTHFSDGWTEYNVLKNFIIEKFQSVLVEMKDIIPVLSEDIHYIGYKYSNLLMNISWLKGRELSTEEPIVKLYLVKLSSSDPFNQRIDKRIVKEFTYVFSKNMRWENIWQDKSKKYSTAYFSEALADIVINIFLDFIDKPDKYEARGGFS